MRERTHTRTVYVRGVPIGGGHPVVIQSMTNTPPRDVEAALGQIERLASAGCSIVRLAVPDMDAVAAFKAIRGQTDMPLVADIHFDHRLAVAAIEAGADKVRINPGNIGGEARVREVIAAARAAKIPIRVGVNSGSLEKHLLEKYGAPNATALAKSAIAWITFFEQENFGDIVVSIKASDVLTTIDACRAIARLTFAPQHIGITESGTVRGGTIRSAVGIGALLAEGIGDTIRVSLAGDPVQEIYVAREILKSLELMDGPTVIACPTCGRTQIDVAALAEKVEARVSGMTANIKIAVMGCAVNGPGEAREADIGIAGGKGEGVLFVKGEAVKKIPEDRLLEELIQNIILSEGK